MRIIISLFVSVVTFVIVYHFFGIVAEEINIPLYISYDEPILIGSGPSSYEQYGAGTAIGSIALYFACLAAYLVFNTIVQCGISWANKLIKLNITFITIGILIQFVPIVIISLVFDDMRVDPNYLRGLIIVGLEISLLYINWKYTYHLYSRKKSRLIGYKLWAISDLSKFYYMIIEALNKEDALQLAKTHPSQFKGNEPNKDNMKECEVKSNLLLKCDTRVAGYVKVNKVRFKDR